MNVPDYRFKFNAEFWWFVLVTVVLAVAQPLMDFDPSAIVDLKVWGLALLGGVVRAVAGGIFAFITSKKVS